MRRAMIFLVLATMLAAGSALAWAARHSPIDTVTRPEPDEFEPDKVGRGETLAAIGGCATCHTLPGGGELAGGVRLQTPFGAIYSTNITPDPQTGIGGWPEEAFRRAMRRGVARDGRYLYPAFPYDHFTKMTDEDIGAIYAYLMSRPAVQAPARPQELRFPFNIRLLMAGWNLLFLKEGPLRPDPSQTEAWNRGAYLVEGPGHCAACHSPRNAFGARDRSRDYAGGVAEGWYSPALNDASPAPVPWDEDALVNYLYDGWDEEHGIAAGPMRDVVGHTAALAEDDVSAIATYLLSLQEGRAADEGVADEANSFAEAVAIGGPGPVEAPADPAARRGLAIFERICANCHRSGSESVPLALATAVAGPDPRNLLRVVLEGVQPTENAYFVRPMPGFPTLANEELADLAIFIRGRYSRGPAWPDVPAAVAEVRTGEG